MDITIKLTDEELHDLSNQVQIALWKTGLSEGQLPIMATIAKRVIAAAHEAHDDVPGPAAFEYVGKYFAAKNRAEQLEAQNALLMNSVEQMAQRSALMQSALIEAGLVSKIPPPARLLNGQPITGPA